MKEVIQNFKKAASEFCEIAENIQLSKGVYENGWDAKNIIAHIVFYHEYYSSIVNAIVQKKALPLIDESLNIVNLRSAVDYAKLSRKELLSRFEIAQHELIKNLAKINNTTSIPYTKKGRTYTAEEYIEVITRHINKHSKDLLTKRRNKII